MSRLRRDGTPANDRPGRPPGIHTPHDRRYRVRQTAAWCEELRQWRDAVRRMRRQLAVEGSVALPMLETRTMALCQEARVLLDAVRAQLRTQHAQMVALLESAGDAARDADDAAPQQARGP